MAKKETKFNLEGLEEIVNEEPINSEQEQAENNILTDQQLEEVAQEAEDERKYGSKGLRTFVESAASSASFGLTDQALVKFGGKEAQEALRERRERNEEAAIAGEIAGIVAPALTSGGSSLLAKGASAGIKGAAKAGLAAEKITAKALAKLVDQTGRKQLAKNVITKSLAKGSGSAVEGAFYGTGELIKEDALGTAEFNAENLLASAGAGALIGGAAGGLLGTSEALIPVIKNNKIVDVVSKKINTNIDKRVAGAKLAKLSTADITKLKDTKWGQQIYDNIPDYFKNNLKLKVSDSTDTLFSKANAELARLGDEIGETALQVDKLAKGTSILPTRSKVASRVQNSLREIRDQFAKNPDEVAKKSLKKLDKRIASWDEWLNDSRPIKATEIKELKTDLQKAAKWNRSIDSIPLDGKMDRQVAEAVRQEFMDLADSVSTINTDVGNKLRKLNIDYGTGLTLTKKLKKAVDKEASSEFLKFKDILIADVLTDLSGGVGAATGAIVAKKFLESDLKRKLILLTDIEKANIKVGKKISKGIKNFFSSAKKVAVPTSTKVLLNTSFEIPDESGKRRKKPKTKQEAFKNISDDLTEMTQNQERLINHLATNSLKTGDAAPNTALAMDQAISKGVQFLFDKMPKDISAGASLFNRKWEPSSLELAKFERYLEAVQNPLSVINDLESGSLTRESVEAIKEVYPDMYTRLQSEAIDEIVNNEEVSYEKRLQIGTLLDLPSDTSLLPANIAGLQQSFTDLEQQQNAAKKESNDLNQEGLSKLSMSEDAKSQNEKIVTRG